MISREFAVLVFAVFTVGSLIRAIRDPDTPEGNLNLALNTNFKIVALTPGRHPKLYALTQQLDDAYITERVARIVTIVEGIEKDALLCAPGAVRMSESLDDNLVILPDRAVFDRSARAPGVMHGETFFSPESKPTTILRNKLLETAMIQRRDILKKASNRLLNTQDPFEHVRIHELHVQLDRVILASMKRIAVACAVQKKRLGLQFTYKYNGIYGSDFISTDQAL